MAVSEYKAIPQGLREVGVLSVEEAQLLREMAGYRNRPVHFYDEISTEGLYTIFSREIEGVLQIADRMRDWMASHPEMVDQTL